jgi:hypothetical protein
MDVSSSPSMTPIIDNLTFAVVAVAALAWRRSG